MTKSDHLRVIDGGEPQAPPDPLLGQTIDGRYRIERAVGEGGMGMVYAARHIVLNKPLAMKVLRPEVSRNAEIIARFRQEAQSASAIGNEHIIDISDFGTTPDGSTYFVMELLEGSPLSEVLEREQPMDPRKAVHVAKQLCLALGAAHERGIVHRDLKPDNVFLVERGGDPSFVKVLDFGIAKVGDGPSHLTQAGQVFGTPHYMSPEQCAGSGVDHRTDIYALGVILYEMCAARVPFDADNLMGILTKHMYEEPPPPHTLPPPVSVPPGLEAVILKCLAKSADARYQTMGEVWGDLDRLEQGGTPEAVLQQIDRRSSRGRDVPARSSAMGIEVGDAPALPERKLGRAAIAVGVGVLLAGAGAFAAFGGQRAEGGPATAATAATTPLVPEPAADAPVPTGVEAPSAAAAPATVELTSEPDGVEVWKGEELLGNTPLPLPRPAGEDRLELQLRHAGYESQDVRISSLTAPTVKVTLVKEAGSARRGRREEARQRPEPAAAPQPAPNPRRTSPSELRDPWERN